MEKAKKELELITRYFSEFTNKQLQQLELLWPLYLEWNSRINVISRKDMDSLYERHVLHSLSIAAVFDFPDNSYVIDIGTGGGFPGIPLAIYFPEVHFHLVDSIGKKIKVVEAVANELGLNNVTYAHCRVEEIRDRSFDLAVSRAVAPLKELWQWSKLLIKKKKGPLKDFFTYPNGLICLKGGELSDEIAESECRPRMIEITEVFHEEWFKQKFLLYVER